MTRYRKTWAAFVAAVLTTISLVFDGDVDQGEALALATAWLGVLSVWWFPNDAPEGERPDPNVSERGASDLAIVIVACVFALVIVLILR